VTDDDPATSRPRTLADLLHDLGGIPLSRVRLVPPPGTATTGDVERNDDCELIDGTLVERATGICKGVLAVHISCLLGGLVRGENRGALIGSRGLFALSCGSVRSAPVAFFRWEQFPGRRIPDESVPAVAPDLAVEILADGNTSGEMARKRKELFAAGTRLVWTVDPASRVIDVYTSDGVARALTESDALDGGAVLPGFVVPVQDVFAELDRHG
jgi:Uma2 family endonuclease